MRLATLVTQVPLLYGVMILSDVYKCLQGSNSAVVTNMLDWLDNKQQATQKHAQCFSHHTATRPAMEWRRRYAVWVFRQRSTIFCVS